MVDGFSCDYHDSSIVNSCACPEPITTFAKAHVLPCARPDHSTFSKAPAQVAAVVVGFDRHINYHKIQYATLCIRENPGCEFIATNLDAVTHLTDAQEWAGNGSMVGAIKGSTKREPTVVGKPADFMLSNIAE